MCVWITHGEAETRQLGRQIGATLEPGARCLLVGAMGCGKTVFAQGIGEGLGFDPRQIQSPTFTLIHQHDRDGVCLMHLDLYRLDAEDFDSLGLAEIMESPAVKVVEWAERLPSWCQEGRCFVFERVSTGSDSERRIREQSRVVMAPERGSKPS